MQHLRRLDASTEPQMGPQQTQPGAAEHGFGGDPRQQGDSQPKPEPWSQQETAAFVLGLYLWGEQFTSIQALIGTKTVRQSHCEKCFSAGRIGGGWGLPSAMPGSPWPHSIGYTVLVHQIWGLMRRAASAVKSACDVLDGCSGTRCWVQVDEVVMFYYDKVVGSVLHRRWQEALLNGGLKGEALISGERQARIRGQLSECPYRPDTLAH